MCKTRKGRLSGTHYGLYDSPQVSPKLQEEMMKLNLSREEALACCIALAKEKPYKWQKQALAKLDKAMGFKRGEDENINQ